MKVEAASPGRDAELGRQPAGVLFGEGGGQAVHARHQGRGEPVEVLAGRVEDEALAVPLEQRGRELRLQRTHVLRYG